MANNKKNRKKQVTEGLGNGVTKFSKTCYRGSSWMFGKQYDVYFTNLKDARAWIKGNKEFKKEILACAGPGVVKTKKREGCLYPELPIGLHENLDSKILADGSRGFYPTIVATMCKKDGTVVHRTAAYGLIRSREEAIALVEEKRRNYIGSHKKEFRNSSC